MSLLLHISTASVKGRSEMGEEEISDKWKDGGSGKKTKQMKVNCKEGDGEKKRENGKGVIRSGNMEETVDVWKSSAMLVRSTITINILYVSPYITQY